LSFAAIFVRSDLDDAGLSPAAFRVLAHLARRAGSNGEAFPGVASMAKTCQLNRDTIWRALSELEAAGWLKRRQRLGASTVYTLVEAASGKEGVAEKEGCPLVSAGGSGKVRAGGSGKGGVGPSGKEGVLRVSTEGNPKKGIHGRVCHPLAPTVPTWSDLSDGERQQIAAHAGTDAAAEAAFGSWRGRKLNFRDKVDSTADAVSMVIDDIKRPPTSARLAKLTRVVLGSPTMPVEVDLSEQWQGKPRYRNIGTHAIGLPNVLDDKCA
jgi:DNA-binding MarR family transcriptional regulator